MLRQSLDALARFSPRFRRVMMRTWYEALVVIDREKQITFMNYGYADLDSEPLMLSDEEKVNRYARRSWKSVPAEAEAPPTSRDVSTRDQCWESTSAETP
jgi:hypothetical protein